MTYFFNYLTVYKRNAIEHRKKGSIPSFPKRGNREINKNYRGVIFTGIATKVYNILIFNRIQSKTEKTIGKNQNGFQRNRSLT